MNESKQIQFVTPAELSDMLGVKVATVHRWVRIGLIPCLRLSSKVIRFDLADVQRSLREKASTNSAEVVSSG